MGDQDSFKLSEAPIGLQPRISCVSVVSRHFNLLVEIASYVPYVISSGAFRQRSINCTQSDWFKYQGMEHIVLYWPLARTDAKR